VSDDTSTLIAQNLKKLREKMGWSQAALAEQSGVPRPTIAHLEAGQANPTLAVALKVARALGTTVDQLVVPPDEAVTVLSTRAMPAVRLAKGKRIELLSGATMSAGGLERYELKAQSKVRFAMPASGVALLLAESGEFVLTWPEGSARLPEQHLGWVRTEVELASDHGGVLYRLSGLSAG
jgi:transcriptional regulator with XRE-family HTH domain